MAKTEKPEAVVTEPMAETEKEYDPFEDKVTVNIAPPTEADEGKGRFVSVNSYSAYIAYGEDVEVPRFVLAVLENQKMAHNDLRKNERKRQQKA